MAAHRKPKQSPLGGQAGRTAATLALASAATATLFEGSGHAEPRPTTAQVKEKVDRLYEEAEVATERYNGAKEKADEARAAFERLRDEAARRTQRLNTARDGLGAMAAAQYRAGGLDPAVRLALTSNPEPLGQLGDAGGAALAHQGQQSVVSFGSTLAHGAVPPRGGGGSPTLDHTRPRMIER